jgi:hypothetical protein
VGHGHIGNVGAPHLVGPRDRKPAQQVGILAVRGVGNTRTRPAPDCLQAHLPAQPLEALAVDALREIALQDGDQPAAPKAGIAQVDFIKNPLDPQVIRALGHGLVIKG